jgi:hypothetical protein
VKRDSYKRLIGKPEGKRGLGIPKCRWKKNFIIYLEECGTGGCELDYGWSGQGPVAALVSAVMNLRFLLTGGNLLTS